MSESPIEDPRIRGFDVSIRPATTEEQRGIRQGPPPKPTSISAREIAVVNQSSRRRATAPDPSSRRRDEPGDPSVGVKPNNRRYVQVLLSPIWSERLDQAAESEDVVFAEVLMDAVHWFEQQPRDEAVERRRRRRTERGIRRAILVRQNEAEEIGVLATRIGISGSALMRMALEGYLSSRTGPDL